MDSSCRSKFGAFTLTLLVVALGLIWAPAVQARTPAKKPVAPPDKRILITAVDVKNQQVTFTYEKDKSTKVYAIDDMTKIVAQGNPGTIDKIKVGQQVYGYTERDFKSLDSLDVAQAQPAPIVPGAKKKK